MDMTKAFDLVKHSVLFKKLIQAGLPLIFVRLLLFIYMKQYANVKWNNSYSSMFSLSNGVRQGGVISAILYCFYGNMLFTELRRSGYGCHVNGFYRGIFGYSDDNMLLASEHALQKMLEICERFATSHNHLSEMRLRGNNLPWVNAFKHLGNNISNQHCLTDQDISVKRAIFVNNCIELNQEFSFADPDTKWKIGQIYNSHYTGSPIWDLFGPEALHLESSYNRNVKIVYDLPLATHRHLIETVTRTTHLQKTLVSRFLGFIDQIKMSNKQIPKMLLKTI